MQPDQLEKHIQQLCQVMHWSPAGVQQAVASASIGPASFLQLLALPLQQTADRIQDLSTALGAPTAVAAQLVQYHPALLHIGPAVLRSRLFAISQADGSSCEELLAQLDTQQLRGLSGLLLLSPSKLEGQLQGLRALLVSLQQQQQRQSQSQQQLSTGACTSASSTGWQVSGQHVDRLAGRLLLRLGTRVTLPDAQVKAVTLQGVARMEQPWQQELAAADDTQLAALLSASHEGLAQAKYLAATGQCAGVTLSQAVLLAPAKFGSRWPGYVVWLTGIETS